MNLVTLLGFIAGAITTTANIPQLIKIYKLKDANDISAFTYILLLVGFILWIIYALCINDFPLLIANIVSLGVVIGILILKEKYKKKTPKAIR